MTSETPRGNTPEENPEEVLPKKALDVLRAARTVFFLRGFSATSMDMIQREAGVSKATIYQHFRSKVKLFSAVIRWDCRRQVQDIRLEHAEGGSVRERLRGIGQAYLNLLLREDTTALYRTLLEVSTVFPELLEEFYNAGPAHVLCCIEDILQRAVAAGELRIHPDELATAATLFVAMARGEPFVQRMLFPKKSYMQEKANAWIDVVVEKFLVIYG